MSQSASNGNCPDCSPLSRRNFLKTTVGGVAAASAASAGLISVGSLAKSASAAIEYPKQQPETLVTALYKTITDEQRKAVCFPFDHPLRSAVDNNWNITKQRIKDFFTKDQQALIRDIFIGMHNPEYAERVMEQVTHDSVDIGGFGACSIAL